MKVLRLEKKYYAIANNAFAFEDKPYMYRTWAKL